MRIIFVFLSLLLANPIMAAVYKHVDEQGSVSYSDHAISGKAKQIEVAKPVMTMASYSPSSSTSLRPNKTKAPIQNNLQGTSNYYTNLTITKPADNTRVRNNKGIATISFNIEPNLQANHKVQILIDGEKQGEPSKSSSVSSNKIKHGKHNVSFQIVDNNGKIVASSPTSTFYLLRRHNYSDPNYLGNPNLITAMEKAKNSKDKPEASILPLPIKSNLPVPLKPKKD